MCFFQNAAADQVYGAVDKEKFYASSFSDQKLGYFATASDRNGDADALFFEQHTRVPGEEDQR